MMSSENKLSVKVYHIENKATKEIRKFSVEADVVGSFEYLIGKIRQAFPDLLRKDLELFWKDEEDDYLTISSNDELDQAIQAIPVGSSNLKLYVKGKEEKTKATNEEHPGITCDGCEGNIRGYRYKCSQCYDFDLCSSCEAKSVHPADHEMILIKSPRQYASGYYMRHPKFSRGHCRGRGGPFQRGFHFRGGPFHGRRPFHCRFGGQEGPCGTTNGQDEKQGPCAGNQNEEKFKECVGRLASAFGLDPDVAVSSVKSFFDDLPKESDPPKENDKSENKKEEPTQEGMDDFVSHIAGSFGIDPAFIAHVTTTVFPQCSTEKKTEEKPSSEEKTTKETTSSKEEDVDFKAESSTQSAESATVDEGEKMEAELNQTPGSEEKKDIQGFEEMVSHFAKQFGFTPENQQSTEGLGELLQRMFQSFPNPNAPNEVPSQCLNKDEDAPKKPDEFIFVDNKDDQLSEEEKFQQRLDKALRQMEAMGFDNDNGWLSQLLVSKELSIGRVLDALNPQN